MDSGVARYHPDLNERIHPYGFNVDWIKYSVGSSVYYAIKSTFGFGRGQPWKPSYAASGHGTCVAGIVGAEATGPFPGGTGVAGIDWATPILPIAMMNWTELPSLPPGEGTFFSAAMCTEAFYLVGVMKRRYVTYPGRIPGWDPLLLPQDPRIVNMSWGTPVPRGTWENNLFPWSKRGLWWSAIRKIAFSGSNYYFTKGTVFVGSAGNDGNLLSETRPPAPYVWMRASPACLDNVISVGAVNRQGWRAPFDEREDPPGKLVSASNFGDLVDVSAPGVGVLTTDIPLGQYGYSTW